MQTNIGGFLTFLVLFAFGTGIAITLKHSPSPNPNISIDKGEFPIKSNVNKMDNRLKFCKALIKEAEKEIEVLNKNINWYVSVTKSNEKEIDKLSKELRQQSDTIFQLEQTVMSKDVLIFEEKEKNRIIQDSVQALRNQVSVLIYDLNALNLKYERNRKFFLNFLKIGMPLIAIIAIGGGFLVYRRRKKLDFV